ncbi:uncharacterized protein LOC118738589, partial [Rhagoletis pomonella]|uniref:uncharacterized protein LOC118738589 n=1 Tax=Rhagoletis pomonella TaxID=28610 RepID=UPI00177A8EE6
MGSVDLMNSYMGRNGLRMKTMDTMTRIFYHLLDMATTNAFILYRRKKSSFTEEERKEKDLTLYQFRLELAKALSISADKPTVGRPSNAPQPVLSNNTIGKRATHPVGEIRYDQLSHIPEWGSKKSCKLCKKSDTQTFCTKCKLHLCFS